MNRREPPEQNERNDWSLYGFLHSLLDDEARFQRLMAFSRLLLRALALVVLLVVALVIGYLLLKGDVIAWYYHQTPHATEWQRWGIPTGGIGVVFGGMRFFGYRKRAKKHRRVDEAARNLLGSGRAPEPESHPPPGQHHDPLPDPGRGQGQSGGDAHPDSGSRPAGEP